MNHREYEDLSTENVVDILRRTFIEHFEDAVYEYAFRDEGSVEDPHMYEMLRDMINELHARFPLPVVED